MNLKSTLLKAAFLGLSFTGVLNAADKIGEIPLAGTSTNKEFMAVSPNSTSKAIAWQEFTNKNGAWNAVLDPITNTPTRAFGKAVRISGFDVINESNVEQAVVKFLNENAGVLNVNPANLIITRKDFVNHRWYITLKQFYQGMEVINSEVELRIFENGNVPAFGVKYYNDIKISNEIKLSNVQAGEMASQGITKSNKFESTLASDKMYVLPISNGKTYDYKIVYKCKVNNQYDKFISYVDAGSGSVLWRFNTTSKAEINITSNGTVKKNFATDKPVDVNFVNMAVKVNGITDTLDHQGKLTKSYTLPATVSATLEGRYVKVSADGRNSAAYTGTITNPGDFKIEFNDNNSHRYERNMYYYSNNVHEFFRDLDSSMHVLDKQFYVELQYRQDDYNMGANAMSGGDTITFLDVHLEDMLMADGPSVFYHEFGHSVNKLFYDKRNGGLGMINAACNEGTADINCAMIIDSPEVGHGVYADDSTKVIRTCKNTYKYPKDVSGESHNDGQIIAGAFWDIRELTDLQTLRKLAHYARYGMPDGTDFGEACLKWFVETLVADDNDGDLSNGTPNMQAIITGYNNHGIGTNLMLKSSFTHTPVADCSDDVTNYKANFKLNTGNATFLKLDSAYLVYRTITASGKSANQRIRAELVDTSFSAVIPKQAHGSIVEYWFEVSDVISKSFTKLYSNNETEDPYRFLVGFKTAKLDNFEAKTWTIGDKTDKATVSKWEFGTPQELNVAEYGYFKPGSDHTESGKYCYVTGVKSPTQAQIEANLQMVLLTYGLNGKTTLTSPVYDLTNLEFPVIRVYDFYKYVTIPISEITGLPCEFYLESSNDGGTTWTKTKSFNSKSGWESNIIQITQPLTNTMKFRFIATVQQQMFGFPAAFVCATVDDFEILTTNNNILGVEDDNLATSNNLVSPNPFGEYVNINVGSLNSTLKIYDSFGNLVFTKENLTGKFEWNGLDNTGNNVPDGAYFYNILSSTNSVTGKIVRIK